MSVDNRRLFGRLWKNEYYRRSLVNYMTKGVVLRDRRNTIAAIYNLIRNNLFREDVEIFKLVRDVLDGFPRESRSNERSSERADAVVRLVGDDRRISRYLDYGCGDGTITHQIGAAYGLDTGEIFGVDIHHTDNPNITYLKADNAVQTLDRGSFDLITAFVSLHHIPSIERTISYLRDLLSPTGILIIREHDSDEWNPNSPEYLPMFLNLIHTWISVKEYEKCNPHELYSGIQYRRATTWTSLMAKSELHLITKEQYTGNNPQGLYYAVYGAKK